MSLITPRQVQITQIARRQVEKASNGVFDEAQWRMTLRNVGKVKPDGEGRVSVKALDQAGFEHVMAFLEEKGYREPGRSEEFWRSRPGVADGRATSRQLKEIERLAAGGRYPLEAMVRRLSYGRQTEVERLTLRQAHQLIEALKAISERETKPARQQVATAPAIHGGSDV